MKNYKESERSVRREGKQATVDGNNERNGKMRQSKRSKKGV